MNARTDKATGKTPAQEFLDLIRHHIAGIRADVPHLIELGEKMAEPLLAGGHIFTPRVSPYWPSEFGGRAGGFRCLKGKTENPGDVAYFTLPDPRHWDAEKDEKLRELLDGKAQLFVIGRPEDLGPLGQHERFAGFTGGAWSNRGLYAYERFQPLATTRPFEQFVRGWITTGEIVVACINQEKMPIIWMSVWLEGAMVRNASFEYSEPSNAGEPNEFGMTLPLQFFHRERFIPYLPSGYAAEEFLKFAEMIVEKLDSQTERLAQAGQWLAEARAAGKRTHAVAVGHSHPEVLEIGDDGVYPIGWGKPISNLLKATPEDFGPGDVLLHLGYGPIHLENLNNLLKRGVKVIHTTPFGLRKGVPDHKNFMWFDLPWRPADQLVDIPGYGARILPSSSTAHAIAYPAILCEFANAAGLPKS